MTANLQQQVLFFTNHYRYNPFFEDTLKRVIQQGYKVVVLDTGGPSVFGQLPDLGCEQYVIPTTSYDAGMMYLHQNKILDKPGYQVLCHLDNDCFLTGTEELEQYLTEFLDGGYDFVCHTVGHVDSNRVCTGAGQITEVTDQQITYSPGSDIPSPSPHYENAYLLLSTKMWNQLTTPEVGHMRKFIGGVAQRGGKMGAHKASYRWDYTNWGKEWYHIGHIMEKYLTLESGRNLTYPKESEFDIYRAGFFAAWKYHYPEKVSELAGYLMERLWNHFGGYEKCLATWIRINQEEQTPMARWQRL